MSDGLSLETLGQRVVIIGPSCSGKSTLGARLAEQIAAPFVELDALYWKPGWQPSGDAEFQERIRSATAGDRWIVAGNYRRHTVESVWPRTESIVWLDFPMRLVLSPHRHQVLAALSTEGAALGHELRAVLAATQGVESGRLAHRLHVA